MKYLRRPVLTLLAIWLTLSAVGCVGSKKIATPPPMTPANVEVLYMEREDLICLTPSDAKNLTDWILRAQAWMKAVYGSAGQ